MADRRYTFDLFFMGQESTLDGEGKLVLTEVTIPEGHSVEGWDLVTHHGQPAILLVTSQDSIRKGVGFSARHRHHG